jgi:hypothetical protein
MRAGRGLELRIEGPRRIVGSRYTLGLMRRLAAACVTLFSTAIALPAQQTGSLSGRVFEPAGSVLPGVTVTAVGEGRHTGVTQSGGDYRIENLPTGTYTVTATIPGFQAATNTIEIRPGENTTLEFVLRLGCLGELDPPLWVVYPFAETLTMVDAVAYVRIRSVGDRERVLVETSCWFIRQVVADVIDMIDPQGTSPEIGTLRLNAGGWERSLAPGDEVIMFLRRGPGSVYAEVETSRLAVRDGRVDRVPVDAPQMRDGDAVQTVLNAIREAVRRNLARP